MGRSGPSQTDLAKCNNHSSGLKKLAGGRLDLNKSIARHRGRVTRSGDDRLVQGATRSGDDRLVLGAGQPTVVTTDWS